MSFESDEKVINNLTTFIKTSISSKLPEHDSFFASLIASACKAASFQSSRLESDKQTRSFSVDDIRVQKIAGGGLEDSFVVNGLTVFNRLLAGAKTVEDGEVDLEDVKIAAFNGSVDTMNTETKGVVVMENAEQLLNFSKGEEEKMEGEVKRLSELGVKVILSGGKFGDMALHFMKQTGIWGLEITSKFDLRRAVKLTGCRAIPSWVLLTIYI